MVHQEKILVLAPNWIGDQILSYPFFHFLRKAFPKAWIAVACRKYVHAVQFRNLINDIFILPAALNRSWNSKLDALENGARVLRQGGPWDLGIALPQSFSAGYLLFRSNVKVRRGFNTDSRRFFLNDRLKLDASKIEYRADSYLQLVPATQAAIEAAPEIVENGLPPAKEFWGVLPENELDQPKLGILEHFDAEKAWPDAEPLDPPQEPYWVLAPGSAAESRRWPEQRFATLAGLIAQEKGWPGILVGGPGEIQIAERLAEDRKLKLLDWTARGTPTSYWKVFRNAQFTLSNDSGLAHVAALCGSPVQIVWGAGNPKRTEPLGPGKVRILFNPVDCWPCEQNTCWQPIERKLDCLKGIEAHTVWKEIKAGLRL